MNPLSDEQIEPLFQKTLALVRAFSEHKLKKDATCFWKAKRAEVKAIVPFEDRPRTY